MLSLPVMKEYSAKHFKKKLTLQSLRDARKAARPVFAPGEAELFLETESGTQYHRLTPVSIPGYTHSF